MTDESVGELDNSLGAYLRREREKRRLSIEKVSAATKIGVRQLYALESDLYEELPAGPFVRGFIHSYCRFLGISSDEVLEKFGGELKKQLSGRAPKTTVTAGYAFEASSADRSKWVLGSVLAAFLVIGGVMVLIVKPTLKHRRGVKNSEVVAVVAPEPLPLSSVVPSPSVAPSPSPDPSSSFGALATVSAPASSLEPSSSPSPSPLPTSTPSPSPSPSGKPDPLQSGVNLTEKEIKWKVILKAKEDLWIRYRTDNLKEMKIIVRKDRVLVLRAKDWIALQLSKAEVASISLNGHTIVDLSTHPGRLQGLQNPTWVFPSQMAEKAKEFFLRSPALGEVPAPANGT